MCVCMCVCVKSTLARSLPENNLLLQFAWSIINRLPLYY